MIQSYKNSGIKLFGMFIAIFVILFAFTMIFFDVLVRLGVFTWSGLYVNLSWGIALTLSIYLSFFRWNYTIQSHHDKVVFLRGKKIHKEYSKHDYYFEGHTYRNSRMLQVFDKRTGKRKKGHFLELSYADYQKLIEAVANSKRK